MKKIDSFIINRITLSGFKCFDGTISFDFGETSFVTGKNGSGKSSIADAIAFAVTGQPFFGDRSSDRLGNPDCDATEVIMDFTDEQGEPHQLTRYRKNSKMRIMLDSYTVRQTDLNHMFGERDVFLSIFNPLYFIEVLAEDGKALLEKLLPMVSHEQTLSAVSEHARTLLADEKMLSPETYLQNRRAEIRELEGALLIQQGRDDQIRKQSHEKQQQLAEYLQQADERGLTADSSLREQIRELERKLDERRSTQYSSQYAQAIADMRAELKTLYSEHARLTKLQKEGKCPVCLQSTGSSEPIRAAVADIVTKGKTLKAQVSEAEQLDAEALAVFEQFKTDDISQMEAERDTLRDRYDKTQRLLDAIEDIQDWLAENTPSTETAEAITEQIKSKKELVNAAIEYIAKRAELTFAGLTMNRVSISLMDVIKSTGEVKDTFKFTYQGRSYRWLSLSEKIRAGLEVSELIKTLTGRRYPTFIDNGESVTVIDNVRPSGQVLYAKVVHGTALTVTSKERRASRAA